MYPIEGLTVCHILNISNNLSPYTFYSHNLLIGRFLLGHGLQPLHLAQDASLSLKLGGRADSHFTRESLSFEFQFLDLLF